MDNRDLLERIKLSEKKSRARLVLAIIAALILGALTFYYATMLNRSKTKAVKSEKIAQRLKEDIQESRNNLIAVTDSLTRLLEKCGGPVSDNTSKTIQEDIAKYKRAGYLIYIHDKSARGRTKSSQIEKALRSKGFKVAGIEQIEGKYSSSVRYFYKEDERAAREIQRIILELAGNHPGLKRTRLQPSKNSKAPREQIEIWLDL